jgi:hypothetical protein
MAEIVAGIACSHVPFMAAEENWQRLAESERENLRKGFKHARQVLEESRADILITFADDHFDRCFYDNLPAFLIGVGDEASGPAVEGFDLPQVRVPIAGKLARDRIRQERAGPGGSLQDNRKLNFGDNAKFQTDPHWRDHILFYEYFHGDNGAGLGASHQTGWTGLVAKLIQLFGSLDPKKFLAVGRAAAFAP